jgi:putative tryptophan/tyrosine transport system substrate-binding protein
MDRRAGRRLVLAAGAALALRPFAARSQAGQVHRVAFLSGATESDVALFFASFKQGLGSLGYREGQNLRIEARYARYSATKAAELAAELAAFKPAVIVANGGGIGPACRLSASLPVVFLISGDPVAAGFADNYPRPGRNATGVTLLALDLIAKRLELLQRINPKMRKVAFLASPEHAGQKLELAASHAAAKQFGIDVSYHEARTPSELAATLPSIAAARPDAVLLFSDALMVGQRHRLARFFLEHRIPSAAGWVAFAESGHLISYGPERHAVWRRLAQFVDRIVKGSRPAELAIELPSVMELAVNRRTAAAMNLTVPTEVLIRADRVIDAAPPV